MDDLQIFLDKQVTKYNNASFIENDPVKIPHRFHQIQDIEISGFFAAILAWGQRKSIINSAEKLMNLMDNAPYEFIRFHSESDLKAFIKFAHRTFNASDLLYFIHFLQKHFQTYSSLEDAFVPTPIYSHSTVENALVYFFHYFFSLDHLTRTKKHISSPEKKSACKRLNMFLKWMVRNDSSGVDFGIWKKIRPQQLIIPFDVHVAEVAFSLGLIENRNSTWNNANLLTNRLREYNPQDPVIYDYALFGLGVNKIKNKYS